MNIKIDSGADTVRGKPFTRDGGYARFVIPSGPFATAKIVDDEIQLVPAQASTHRALCAWLEVPADG